MIQHQPTRGALPAFAECWNEISGSFGHHEHVNNPGRFGIWAGSGGRKVESKERAVKIGSYSHFQVFGDILIFFVN